MDSRVSPREKLLSIENCSVVSPDDFEEVVDLAVHFVLDLSQGVEACPELRVVHRWVQQRHHAADEPLVLGLIVRNPSKILGDKHV